MPAMSKEEMKKEFLNGLRNLALFCARKTSTKEEAVQLMAFSVLTMIDGVSNYSSLTPITLVVSGHPEEEIEDRIAECSDYILEDTPINDDCYLHDELGDLGLVAASFYPQLLNHYRKIIEENGDRLPTSEESRASQKHLLWMLTEIEGNNDQSLTKKHRWLGYIQGTLCAYGLTTVDTEREFTRNIFNGN